MRNLRRARGEERRKPKRNRGHLPSHLPRVERAIEPASTLCPCGCGEMAKIGEDGETLFAIDGVDGSRFRHRNVPCWVL